MLEDRNGYNILHWQKSRHKIWVRFANHSSMYCSTNKQPDEAENRVTHVIAAAPWYKMVYALPMSRVSSIFIGRLAACFRTVVLVNRSIFFTLVILVRSKVTVLAQASFRCC